MTHNEILNALRLLKPDIKVSLFNELPYQKTISYKKVEDEEGKVKIIKEEEATPCKGFEPHVVIDNVYIIYNETEDFRPTAEEIKTIFFEKKQEILN